MRFLVTGGAGFLGLHTAHALRERKHDVMLLDIAEYDKKEYPKDCEFIIGDVRDEKLVNKLTKKVDIVIHEAAALPLWKPEEILDTNIRGTETMLRVSLKNNVKRFIHISSTAVYGVPEKHPIEETDPMHGVGPYGISKVEAEGLCIKYRDKGLVVSVIRPKTFVGTHRLGVFEILFDWIKDNKRIPVIGSGNNQYQLMDVEDLTDVIFLLATHKKVSAINDVFNIGAERFETVNKDLQQLFDHVGSSSKTLPTPAFLVKGVLRMLEKIHLSPLYQWVYDTADKDSFASIDKLKKTLNWEPKYSNAEALIRSYEWYKENYVEIKGRKAGVTHTVGWDQGALGFFKKFL